MSCKIQRALEVPLIMAAGRKLSQPPRCATASTKRAITLLVSGVIFAALVGFVQPARAEAPDRFPAQVNAEIYAELLDFAQPSTAAKPKAVAAAEPTSLAEGYSVLSDFVQSNGAAVPAAAGRPAVPDDVYHSTLRGTAHAGIAEAPASLGDEYSALRNYVQSIDAKEPNLVVAAKSDANPHAKGDEYSALRDYVQSIDAKEPNLVVAAATKPVAKPTAAKKLSADAGVTYIGSEACMKCHTNQAGTFKQTLMGKIFLNNPHGPMEKLGCEACHGPGSAHAKAGGAMDTGAPGDIVAFRSDSPRPIEERNAVCLTCHEKGERTYWSGSTHETRGLACTNCHQIMEKVADHQLVKPTELETCYQCHKEKRTQEAKSSHMPLQEGKMTCSSCHNPHGSATDSLLREASINETCYKCHADKRGPFLWEHEPVRDSCVNCHEPHGTNNEYLLKVQRPRLCQQCHQGVGHGLPGNPTVVQAVNRSCQNCHTKIHGSNAPAGMLFQR